MISWHKVGQKVAYSSKEKPDTDLGALPAIDEDHLIFGEVYTISKVFILPCIVKRATKQPAILFHLAERRQVAAYDAKLFSPVYPQALSELRKLCQPSPSQERKKQEAFVLSRYIHQASAQAYQTNLLLKSYLTSAGLL